MWSIASGPCVTWGGTRDKPENVCVGGFTDMAEGDLNVNSIISRLVEGLDISHP